MAMQITGECDHLEDFHDAFSRYAHTPETSETSETNPQPRLNLDGQNVGGGGRDWTVGHPPPMMIHHPPLSLPLSGLGRKFDRHGKLVDRE